MLTRVFHYEGAGSDELVSPYTPPPVAGVKRLQARNGQQVEGPAQGR
jgi:hypothetical protein